MTNEIEQLAIMIEKGGICRKEILMGIDLS
jgi:hypothetical protein